MKSKVKVSEYKNYVIFTEEGIKKGFFFRKPLQKKIFYTNYDIIDKGELSAWQYLYSLDKPIRKLYEILIGNWKVVKNIKKWCTDTQWEGFQANILCSPIYFIRSYKKLIAANTDLDGNIKMITSDGYASIDTVCPNECDIEMTTIYNNGENISLQRKGSYRFTRPDVIKEIIDKGPSEIGESDNE